MKILFVTHDTSRTGAPIVLLYFLKWLKKKHSAIEVTVITLKGGDLREEFKEVVTKYHDFSELVIPVETFYQNFKKKVLQRVGQYKPKPHPKDVLIEKISNENFDLIFANSVASVSMACEIKRFYSSVKLIVHVHELNSIISLKAPDFGKYISQIDILIAASHSVKENLIENYGFEDSRVKVIYEFTERYEVRSLEKKNEFVIGGAGTVHWRKGSDLFILVAKQIKKKCPSLKIRFEWVGSISEEQKIILEADICKIGLSGLISFLGPKDNPFDYFKNFDVFLLPSREDPFPLVAIEVGMLGKPIICFTKATGTAEVLVNGGGAIVPYLDTEAMAEQVILYYEDRAKLRRDGEIAKKLFSAFTPENLCPKLFSILKQELDG